MFNVYLPEEYTIRQTMLRFAPREASRAVTLCASGFLTPARSEASLSGRVKNGLL